ncbi:MAG: SRPBCC domain-containing protein [Opitutaceae bacterium]|nr:SRPBCC domain-containing protein [Cytophagales bacterium]
MDFKEGGKYLMSMQGSDGNKTWSTGKYKEIIHLKKIVNTDSFADSDGNIVPASYYKMPGDWKLELTVTFEFEEVNGKTNPKLQHANFPVEMAKDCIKGWQSSFN